MFLLTVLRRSLSVIGKRDWTGTRIISKDQLEGDDNSPGKK
jgi:hypothetical protein